MSDSEPYEWVTERRLTHWADTLAERSATPMILVGVGHEEHSGEIVVCAVERGLLPFGQLISLLAQTLELLQLQCYGG